MTKTPEWDEIYDWSNVDPKYVAKVMLGNHFHKVLGTMEDGRSLNEQLEHVKKHGVHWSTSALRKSILRGLEIRTKPWDAPAEYMTKVGCACYGTARPVQEYYHLLQKLGIDYNFVKTEHCCLGPVIYQTITRKLDRSEIDKASGEMLALDIDQARKLGVKKFLYYCESCWYKAKWHFPESDIQLFTAMDVLIQPGLWEGKKLRLDKRVGYYGGHPHRMPIYVADPKAVARQPHAEFRKLVDKVEGLTVVDIPHKWCVHVSPELVWGYAREQGLDTIVTPCSMGYGALYATAPRGMRVRSVPSILLQALGHDPW